MKSVQIKSMILTFLMVVGAYVALVPIAHSGIPQPSMLFYGSLQNADGQAITNGNLLFRFEPADGGTAIEYDATVGKLGDNIHFSLTVPIETAPVLDPSKFLAQGTAYLPHVFLNDEEISPVQMASPLTAEGGQIVGPLSYSLSPTVPVLEVSDDIDFGYILVSTYLEKTITISNIGAGTLTGTVSMAKGENFKLTQGGIAVSQVALNIPAEASTEIMVRFQPLVSGANLFDTVQIVTVAGSEDREVRGSAGQVTATPTATATVTPTPEVTDTPTATPTSTSTVTPTPTPTYLNGEAVGYVMVDGYGGIFTTSSQGADVSPFEVAGIVDAPTDLHDLSFGFDIVRGLALTPKQNGFWVLDGFGGLHAFGKAQAPLTISENETQYFYPGWDIARDIEAGSDEAGVFVLDGYGMVHAEGSALDASFLNDAKPYFGWDIARDVEIVPDRSGYVLLDGFGGVHYVGTAEAVYSPGPSTIYFGWDIAKDIEFPLNGTKGYYLLDGFGGMHVQGSAVYLPTAYFGWDIAEDLEILLFEDLLDEPTQHGMAAWLLDGFGGLHPAPPNGGTNMVRFSLNHYLGWDIAKDFEPVTIPQQ